MSVASLVSPPKKTCVRKKLKAEKARHKDTKGQKGMGQ